MSEPKTQKVRQTERNFSLNATAKLSVFYAIKNIIYFCHHQGCYNFGEITRFLLSNLFNEEFQSFLINRLYIFLWYRPPKWETLQDSKPNLWLSLFNCTLAKKIEFIYHEIGKRKKLFCRLVENMSSKIYILLKLISHISK